MENQHKEDYGIQERNLRGLDGHYLDLEVSPLADDPLMGINATHPNARKYSIKVHGDGATQIIEYFDYCERVVIALERIHGIREPWDDAPDYFKKKKK